MSRRYSNLDELIHDLDATESLADDPFVGLDDDDIAILGSMSPDVKRAPRAPAKKPPAKRGRPKKKV